jgi:hypothetical protein
MVLFSLLKKTSNMLKYNYVVLSEEVFQMMKKVFFIFMCIILFYAIVIGCSSFAIYSNINMYGSNFDYPDHFDYRIRIIEGNYTNVLSIEFDPGDRQYKQAVGFNNKGLFANLQSLPLAYSQNFRMDFAFIQIEIPNLLYNYNNADNCILELKNKKLVNLKPFSNHSLIADKLANAYIVAAGENENKIIEMKDNFIVLTNFDIKEDLEITSIKCFRYKNIYNKILENMGNFDVDKGFEILSSAFQIPGTQISAIFLPDELLVYAAFKGNIDKIVEINLNDNKLRTHKGFKDSKEIDLTKNSVKLVEILGWK